MPTPSATTTQNPVEEMIHAPSRMRTEEGEVYERSLKELIEADRYLKGIQDGGDSPFHGLRISKMKPPGTT